jgi:hypothetical protein
MTSTTSLPRQTALENYQRHGYLLPASPVLSSEGFSRLLDRFQRMLTVWTGQYQQRAEAFDKPHFLFPELFDVLFDARLLDLVEPLIGGDIGLFSSHFICKPAGCGQRVPWHEDSAYWSGIFDSSDDICTLWLALDRSDTENGCLRVIEGSQHHGFSSYHPVEDGDQAVFGSEIVRSQVDESKAVDFVLDPNHCSIHNARMIHGSNANRSPRRRCGLSIRYFSTRRKFLGGPLPESFRIYLARGRDHAGNRYADPSGVNQAWINDLLGGSIPPSHL